MYAYIASSLGTSIQISYTIKERSMGHFFLLEYISYIPQNFTMLDCSIMIKAQISIEFTFSLSFSQQILEKYIFSI